MNDAATLEEEQTIISNLFMSVADTIAAQNGQVSMSDKLTFSSNIIFDLIQMTVTEIVMQVLSPKVMLLYALNSYFMGDSADGDFKNINIENFLKGFANLISSMVKQVFELIMEELVKWLMEQLMELITLIIEKLLLERIYYYIEILKRLLAFISMWADFIASFFGRGKSINSDTFIDNVNYADIIPKQIKPKDNTC